MPAPKDNKFAKGNKGGRPTEYDKKYHCDKAFKFALLNVSDKKIADFLDINQSTFVEWKKKHKEFAEALLRGREDADAEIAHALFHRAKGFQHPETVFHVVKIGRDEEEVQATKTVKIYPPDPKAIAMFLANRTKAAEHRWTERVADTGAPNPNGSINLPAGAGSMALTINIIDPVTKTTSKLDIGGSDEETV